MAYTVHNVQPMANTVLRLQNFFGEDRDTEILVAKAVLKGAVTYAKWNNTDKDQPIYGVDTVRGNRAEAIIIQEQLQNIPLKDETARSVGKGILSLEQITEIPTSVNNSRSQILPKLILYMGKETSEYQGKLTLFGGEITSRLEKNIRYCSPETVDVEALKERSASVILKTLYREFNKIRGITEKL